MYTIFGLLCLTGYIMEFYELFDKE
jgi:hypothetical protein